MQGGRAWVKFSPHDAADTENGVVEVKAKVYVPSTNKYCVDIDAYDNPPGQYSKRAFQVRFYPDGVVSYYCKQKNPIKGLTIKTDTWQHVLIRADLKASVFDLTVEGQTAKGLPFGHSDVHRIQTIGFMPNTNNCTMYVDAVEVRVVP